MSKTNVKVTAAAIKSSRSRLHADERTCELLHEGAPAVCIGLFPMVAPFVAPS
jgi:hypothetical protein